MDGILIDGWLEHREMLEYMMYRTGKTERSVFSPLMESLAATCDELYGVMCESERGVVAKLWPEIAASILVAEKGRVGCD